jgi:neutral ceramidase
MLCGTGRRIITPRIGHNLAGYAPGLGNDGAHDDLTVTALYLKEDNREALLLNFDLIGVMGPGAVAVRKAMGRKPGGVDQFNAIRSAVSRATKLPVAQIILTNTHTHSGPVVVGDSDDALELNRKITKWAAEAAADAKASTEPCQLCYNFTDVAENMNRRYSFPDRRFLYIPQNKQLIGQSREYVDRELGIVAFRTKRKFNKYKAVITNYACHPLCVGVTSNELSADYQGVLRRLIEETFDGCMCLATTGTAGDNHPLYPEAGFSAAERMGQSLAQAAIRHCYDAIPVNYDTQLRFSYRPVTFNARDEATVRLLPDVADRKRFPAIDKKISRIKTSVGLLGIGPILFASLPGELVSGLGMSVKWSSPFLKTYLLFLGTDHLGYIPSHNQYLWGGYEPGVSNLAAGSGEHLVSEILAGAHELLKKDQLKLPPVQPPAIGY